MSHILFYSYGLAIWHSLPSNTQIVVKDFRAIGEIDIFIGNTFKSES